MHAISRPFVIKQIPETPGPPRRYVDSAVACMSSLNKPLGANPFWVCHDQETEAFIRLCCTYQYMWGEASQVKVLFQIRRYGLALICCGLALAVACTGAGGPVCSPLGSPLWPTTTSFSRLNLISTWIQRPYCDSDPS